MARSFLQYITGLAIIIATFVIGIGVAALVSIVPENVRLSFSGSRNKTILSIFSNVQIIQPDDISIEWTYTLIECQKSNWIEFKGEKNLRKPYILIPEDMAEFINIKCKNDTLTLNFDFKYKSPTEVIITSERPIEIHIPDSMIRNVYCNLSCLSSILFNNLKSDVISICSLPDVDIDECQFNELQISPLPNRKVMLSTYASTISRITAVPNNNYANYSEFNFSFYDYVPDVVNAAYNSEIAENNVHFYFSENIPSKVTADDRVELQVDCESFTPLISFGSSAASREFLSNTNIQEQ